MGELGDRLAAMVVSVRSPDGQLAAAVRGEDEFRVKVADPRYHRDTDPAMLCHQLAELLARLAQARDRERQRILAEAGFEAADPRRPHWHKPTRDYLAAAAETRAAGTSSDGCLAVATVGMRRFQVRLSGDGRLRRLDEARFTEAVRSATEAVLADYVERLSRLEAELPTP